MRKVSGKKCYRIMNTKTRKVFSKCTSKKKGKKQLRLLRAIQYNKDFVLIPRAKR